MLLGPAAAHIGNKRLLIVGEGVLQYLPFGALPEPGTDTPLMVSHEIVTAPSASVVAVLRQETASRKPAAKLSGCARGPGVPRRRCPHRAAGQDGRPVGGPIPACRTLRGCASAARKPSEITRLAGSGATLKALDFDASRETAMKPDLGEYRIVHFATHSLLNNEHPELSGVVLVAGGSQRTPAERISPAL